MTDASGIDLSSLSLFDLFRSEAGTQTRVLADGLLALERQADDPARIDELMRAAHSLKGAAAIVGLKTVVLLAHQMEDVFVAARSGERMIGREAVDALLAGVDLLEKIGRLEDAEAAAWLDAHEDLMMRTGAMIAAVPQGGGQPAITDPPASIALPVADFRKTEARADGSLKVKVAHLDRLLSLTSQSVVSANLLQPVIQTMHRFKKKHADMFAMLDALQQDASTLDGAGPLQERIHAFSLAAAPLRQELMQRLTSLEDHQRRLVASSRTTLDEVLAVRMRPFQDSMHGLPRMVRDVARSLGKEVHLEIIGQHTLIDRDVLEKIEASLGHLLRNAVDHGMELPEARERAGKPRQGTVCIGARHAGGMLHIEVSDDGQGVDLDRIRRKVVEREMMTQAMAASLNEDELLEFLFLPAFSLKESTSLVSGRGVGLDIVQETVRQQNGTVRLETRAGKGMKTCIVLPLTQSVVRMLVIEIGGQPYGLPVARIKRVMQVESAAIHTLENKPFFNFENAHVGLVDAAQLLGLPTTNRDAGIFSVLMIGEGKQCYGLVVDRLIGENSLAVQPLEPTFGKMRDIAAGALLDDGTPVLILDVPDLLLSIEKRLGEGQLQGLHGHSASIRSDVRRILVVDDSLTVREMERNLLRAQGFVVDTAVDGVDGWNAVRSTDYDLLITDVDMPRMDGIELVTLVKKDARLGALPVMIVSYKDRPEDRARGIEAGADYYLTKGSFHDETLLEAVIDLIGAARP